MKNSIKLLFVFLIFCSVNAFSQTKKITQAEANALCNRVSEIKELPYDYTEKGVDVVYDLLFDAGESVVPCLIEKIADTTIMDDPRCPRISRETKVGDVAFFVLVRITEIKFIEFFPVKVQEKYKTEGVYAYHDYIERKGKRKDLQSKLRNWYQQKQIAKK